jgi:hypothetical protein
LPDRRFEPLEPGDLLGGKTRHHGGEYQATLLSRAVRRSLQSCEKFNIGKLEWPYVP